MKLNNFMIMSDDNETKYSQRVTEKNALAIIAKII